MSSSPRADGSTRRSSTTLQVGLVLVSGPPGVGKSTLTSRLTRQVPPGGSCATTLTHFLPISYDKILDKSLEVELISSESASNADKSSNMWKLSRVIIRQLVCELAGYIQRQEFLLERRGDDDSNSYYKELRKRLNFKNTSIDSEQKPNSATADVVADRIESNFIRNLKENQFYESTQRLCDASGCSALEAQVLYFIIVDDVLYYESMRYEFYRFALKNEIGYFNCCLGTSDLALLLERNRTRPLDERLDAKIVENIYGKFEPPDRVDWERDYCLVLEPGLDEHDVRAVRDAIELKSTAFRRHAIEHNRALDEASRARQLDEQNRQSNERSVIHESDLVIRKLVSSKMAEMSGSATTQEEKTRAAKRLTANKSFLLNELNRQKSSQVPDPGSLYESLRRLLNVEKDLDRFEAELKAKLYEHL